MRVCVLCLRAATELDVTFDSSSRNGKARIPKGWKSFLRRSELLKADSGFLVDGRLKISANVTVKTDKDVDSNVDRAVPSRSAPALKPFLPTLPTKVVNFMRQLGTCELGGTCELLLVLSPLLVLLAMLIAMLIYKLC